MAANEHAIALGRLGGNVRSTAKSDARKKYWQQLTPRQREQIKRRISASRKAAWVIQKRKCNSLLTATSA